ncbi:MAG: phosphate ABC transporter substrate-binding protein [Planctomycetota bacterium]|nr:phosphate ABC transporter substrate-binding protein [Planctomycetota bacterium]
MLKRVVAISAIVLLVTGGFAAADLDKNLPEYKPSSGVSGNIKSVGSDTMNNLMTFWAELFKKYYPSVGIEIEGKGSSTAPPALIAGSSTFGPMSRKMKDKEMDKFVDKFGYKAVQLRTSIDMLAVYVHKDNPIAKTGLTLQQVDAIFSKTRKGGFAKDIKTWGDVGLTGAWASRPITIYGRNSASGTYGYFKKHALFKGDYKDTVKEQPGSSAVVTSVSNDLGGIGYSGIGYKTADVATVPLGVRPGQFIAAVPANAYSGRYPLARFLWCAVNYKPGSQLEPLRREFIKLIFSKQGQKIVAKDGYFPVPNSIARAELAKVGITLSSN